MKVLLLCCEQCHAAFVLKTGEEKKLETMLCTVCRKSSPKLVGEIEVFPKSS